MHDSNVLGGIDERAARAPARARRPACAYTCVYVYRPPAQQRARVHFLYCTPAVDTAVVLVDLGCKGVVNVLMRDGDAGYDSRSEWNLGRRPKKYRTRVQLQRRGNLDLSLFRLLKILQHTHTATPAPSVTNSRARGMRTAIQTDTHLVTMFHHNSSPIGI